MIDPQILQKPFYWIHLFPRSFSKANLSPRSPRSAFLLLWGTIFLGIPTLSAQFGVQGKVRNETGEPLEFATVMLYEADQSTLIDGAITDAQGQFQFAVDKAGQYEIQVEMLGYTALVTDPFALHSSHPSPVLKLDLEEEMHTLSAIEVVAKTPLLEQRADRMILNVGKSLTGLNGSLLDLLKKVPGMVVINGRLCLAGNTNPIILIDGRSTQYLDVQSLLNELPADNIERVELIHQPGAEFAANGAGPIINIIPKKDKRYGWNGTLQTGLGKGEHWRSNTGISISNRRGALQLHGGAGYSNNSQQEYLILNRVVDGYTFSSFNDQPNLPQTYRANLGLDWTLSARHQLGFGLQTSHSNNNRQLGNETRIDVGTMPFAHLETINTATNQSTRYGGESYYSFAIDTLGQTLNIDANYAHLKQNSTAFIQTQDFNRLEDDFGALSNRGSGENNVYAVKADYTKPFNENLGIQLGAKWSSAALRNTLYFDNALGPHWGSENRSENDYRFEENIAALYGKLNVKLGKWEGVLGLRYENSFAQGEAISIDSVSTRRIASFFPSASIYRPLNTKLGLSFAYSYRIERPDYAALNPYVIYFDPLTQQRGNPNLKPEFTHSAKLNLTYDRHPFFSLEYTRTNDVITNLVEQNPVTKALSSYTGNLESYDKIGGTLFFPLDILPGIGGYGGFMLYNEGYQNTRLRETDYRFRRWTFSTFLQVRFPLPGKINTEINGFYTTGGQDGLINFGPMYGLNLGFERKLLDNKLSLGLSIDNLLNRFFYGDVHYGDTNLTMESRWDRKVVNFTLRYHFGH
ncbi:MAG: outer membrane beta-barrel protein [Bacteroidota bacterium]